jgi:general secretion pathway protein E
MNEAGEPDKKLDINEILIWLQKDGMISVKDYQNCKHQASKSKNQDIHPLKLIVECGTADQTQLGRNLTLEGLTQWLAGKVGLPYYYIDPLKIDVSSVTSIFSQAYAVNYNILPVKVTDTDVVVGVSEPFVHAWESDLAKIQNRKLKRVLASPDEIKRYLEEFYNFSKSLKGASINSAHKVDSTLQNFEQLVELGKVSDLDANNHHVVNLVSWLLQYAFDQRASDIHIEPRREQANVRFRIDGVLHQVYQLPSKITNAVMSRLKILGRMDIAEKRMPQDGRIKTQTTQGKEIELRLSTMPTAFGEKMVMRIFDPDVLLRNFRQLGLNKRERSLWKSMSGQAHGIILVTGPTGSGKTTTLYSTLKNLAKPEVNLCTVEDPIELIEPSFNQMQVQQNIGLNFANGIRTLLRQDPDIIMVGEIRDLETAEMAVQASLTGHLVLSTLHTNDAPSAVTRLLEIGIPAYLIQQTLLGVMAQRLLRVLCPHCKKEVEIDDAEWAALIEPFKADKPNTIYQAIGCNDCRNTGYSGRIGIYEIFENSSALKKLMVDGCDNTAIRKQAVTEGMRPLRFSGAEKVAKGITTIEEVLRVVPQGIEL